MQFDRDAICAYSVTKMSHSDNDGGRHHVRRARSDYSVPWRRWIASPRDIPRWLFLGTLIFAPWAYGGTDSTSISIINLSLGVVIGLWILGLVVARKRPAIPMVLLIVATAILGLGWLMALNPSAIYDTEFEIFAPMRKSLAFAPSSVDGAVSVAWMVRASALTGSVLFVADLSLRRLWVRRIWITVGLAGGSIALLGLLQRATGAVLPFWEYRTSESSTFFATYYYHANAGAFLNLVLAPTMGLALRAFSKPGRQAIQRAIWFTATLLILIAIVVNTSRVAQLLGLLALVALSFGPARRSLYGAVKEHPGAVAVIFVIALALLFGAGQANIAGTPLQRWSRAIEQIPKDSRWEAYDVAVRVLPDAGGLGFGPGTFESIFPDYEQLYGVAEPGHWEFLHQDYLQIVLEWGWAGAPGWAVIFLGGIGVGWLSLTRLRRIEPASPLCRVLPLVLIALATVAVHSLVDFPLQIASLQLYAATYLGICWGSQRANRQLAHK